MKKLLLVASLLSITALGTSTAFASPTYGTYAISVLGTVTSTPTNTALNDITSVTFPTDLFISSIPSTYLGQPNAFLNVLKLGQTVLTNPSPLSIAIPAINTTVVENAPNLLTFGPTGQYKFSLATLTTTAAVSNNLGLEGLGSFTDYAGALGNNIPAEIAASFSQVTPGSAISVSLTFDVPPGAVPVPIPVPEPSSLLLLGTGLLGIGLIVRQRRNHSYSSNKLAE
jgi:hypothetical protein